MLRSRVVLLSVALGALLVACGDKSSDTDVAADVAAEATDTTTDLAGDQATDPGQPDQPEPLGTCLESIEADKGYTLPGLQAPVDVVTDSFGVPHVYAANEHDLFAAEGFVVARNRFIQMHGLRRVSSGTFSSVPAAGASDLANDVYFRVLGMRRVAEEMWTQIQADQPGVEAMLLAFSEGVNAYIDAVRARKVNEPLEWAFLGDIEPWTPVDSLVIGRLQSWDLAFESNGDKIERMQRVLELQSKFTGTEFEGIQDDLYPIAPAEPTLPVPADASRRSSALRTDYLRAGFFQSLNPAWLGGVRQALASVPMKPGAMSVPGFGSNNWTVSGAHTTNGQPIVANDTHLALRNPAVFFEIHLNTVRAGGDLDLAGVCFPGIPGIILGSNGVAAWGATVYYADVTDVYVEKWTAGTPSTVLFNGQQVAVEVHDEVLDYQKPAEGCESWLNPFIKGTTYEVAEVDGHCRLTVHLETVPHHGPVIPGSKGQDLGGAPIALTWKWTGFEPTSELAAVYGLMKMKSTDDFFWALENFGVGAQNWVYGDVNGHIAYSAYVHVPVREHLKTAPVVYPPWLPFPGEGGCEWDGMVPLDKMPHAIDPAQGFVITANGDSLGHTVDGDPLNDWSYQGYGFANGLRAHRIRERFDALLANGGKVDRAALQSVQADHLSPLGRRLTEHILTAVDAAEKAAANDPDVNPAYAVYATDDIKAARDRLAAWDFQAESGVGDGVTADQKASAVATSIFNTWLVFVAKGVLDSKGVASYDTGVQEKFLLNLFNAPETLATYSEILGDSTLWDDPDSEEIQEDRTLVVLAALDTALNFLADPAKVGVAAGGGFGSDDMDTWLWGKLHTVTMRGALGGEANIPPESAFPEGFPRPGDNEVVDACHPGLGDTRFTFGNGPAIRNVFECDADGVKASVVIPGGQDGNFGSAHYRDLFDLWSTNQTHALHRVEADVKDAAEACWKIVP